jgi:hypothetical protein
MTTVLKHTTEKGQLRSITDSTAQHTPGAEYVDKYGAHYEYGYNGSGSAMKQNRPCYRSWGAGGTNPHWEDIADGDKFYCTLGIPQADIPSTYWGWFHWKGPTTNDMYLDPINHDGTLDVTAGEALCILDGLCAANALALTDQQDFCVATGTTETGALDMEVWLFGTETLTTDST